jgi:cytoskeletal protein CcmA (bactofilin family)
MSDNKQPLSILDQGLIINGKIESDGEVIIRGKVTGTITAETLVIAESGIVDADCTAEAVIIGGDYNGNLTVNGIMKILSTGKCSGKVLCQDMVVENGSTLNASVDCSLGSNIN